MSTILLILLIKDPTLVIVILLEFESSFVIYCNKIGNNGVLLLFWTAKLEVLKVYKRKYQILWDSDPT